MRNSDIKDLSPPQQSAVLAYLAARTAYWQRKILAEQRRPRRSVRS